MANFEQAFGRFVQSIGGEIVPRCAQESADYIFRAEKVVAELKTLEEDSLPSHVQKLSALFENWQRRGLIRVFGTATIDIQTVPQELQREWLDLIEPPIEGIIRKANGQIRSTKEVHQLSAAKGLLLIVNDGNFLHTVPVNFMISVGRILQKKDELCQSRFPHIRGVVYFSYRIPAAGDPALFWLPGTMEPAADADLSTFQDRLQREWFAYFASLVRRPVTTSPRVA